MVLKTIYGSPSVTFKRQQSKDVKGACFNVLIKCKKHKISAVRGFPDGCGRYGRTVADRLNDPVQAGMIGLRHYPGFGEMLSAASVEKMGVYMPKALDAKGLFSLSKIGSYEASALTKKAVAKVSVRVYPPGRKISAIRCFPQGCYGGKASQACKDIARESLVCKVNGLEYNASCVENMSHKKEAVVGILPRLYPPRRRISAIRCFPEGCRRKSTI